MVSGIGVDVVNIQRMERLSDHVKSRIFHPRELDEAKTMAEGVQAEFLAGRFAAKEALGKASGPVLHIFHYRISGSREPLPGSLNYTSRETYKHW